MSCHCAPANQEKIYCHEIVTAAKHVYKSHTKVKKVKKPITTNWATTSAVGIIDCFNVCVRSVCTFV
jgi:hypothetical protein